MKKSKKPKEAKNQKKSFFNNYSEAWNFLKESKNYIYGVIIIFLISCLAGYFLPVPGFIEEIILRFIRELLEKTRNMSMIELINFIFINNLKVSFAGVAMGIFLGIFPLIESLGNGYFLGIVASKSVKMDGVLSLWKLFPHGIFELPAIFISLGMGLRIGFYFFKSKKKRKKSLWKLIAESLKVFVLVVIPLLAIAAVIESAFIFALK